MQLFKLLAAGAAWMLAVMLMVVATTDSESVLRGWSIMVGLFAWMPTQSLFLDHHVNARLQVERLRTERLVQALAVEFAEAELPRIAGRRDHS